MYTYIKIKYDIPRKQSKKYFIKFNLCGIGNISDYIDSTGVYHAITE